ncbi:MAG: sigma 54-interacting transcriptional regulator [Deltaproteobacteria bacterium]|nr:sigma 54-interacting transcriptional regulator [Deltaproteobacteria bacterium]
MRAFKFEFAFLKDLRHPNVVRIQDFGYDESLRRFYFTEEYLEGKPLPNFAKGASPEAIAELFLQAIHGLQAIHRARLLHGDLKGNNLIVVEEGGVPRVKLIDLGLADPRFSLTGGTPSTMAPEKILKEAADERSDLYSLGVVFYQLFGGENPFARRTIAETYEAHLTVKAPKLSLKNPKVPSYWNEIFETLLQKNPARRYRSAAELLAAIDFGRPAKDATPRPRPWRLERWIGREALMSDLTARVRTALRAKGKRRAFLLVGESGAGKSRVAQELKYQFQMEKIRVTAPSREASDLWILEEGAVLDGNQDFPWHGEAAPSVLILTVVPEHRSALEKSLEQEGWKVEAVEVPCFTRHELADFLRELSGLEKIPENFLKRLWEKTHGNPQLVVALLEQLAQQQRWIDAQGRWNLAVFREADLDFETASLDLPEIDSALAALSSEDHVARAELWMKRAEELMKNHRLEAAADSLTKAEIEAQAVEDLSRKLSLRAGIYERQGLHRIVAQRYEEAMARFERALALLEESGVREGPRYLRAQNYLAWLLCQEGKIDEAIALFQAVQGRWRALPAPEQEKVLNQDLGYAYLLKGDAVSAVSALQEMLPFYRRVGDPRTLMKVHYNLGEAQLLAKDYSAAIESFLEASALMRLHRNFEFLLRAYNGLGKAHHLLGERETALDDYGHGMELANYLEDFSSAAALAQNIGSIQAERGDFEPARGNFELALKLLKKLPEKTAYAKYLEARARVEIGDLFRRQGRFAEAETSARDADRLTQQEDSLAGFRFWVLLTRAEIARDEGDQVRLQDLLAELLPLADDEEKRGRCAELHAGTVGQGPAVSTVSDKNPDEAARTRVESIAPGTSLLVAERRLSEERDPEVLRRLIRELQDRLDRSQQDLTRAREGLIESSVLVRFAEMNFVSRNKEMQELFRTVERVRDTDLSVVLHGESGTGKELLARSLHEHSRRHSGPFVAVNCAALPATLIEAELFGYKAGAFTGANRDKAGLIESAEGGTLFLDEIAELELPLQAKLLRVLQEKEITRLGETRARSVKFRLLSASHRRLGDQVKNGDFREDLYYRIAELELFLPPLRERKEDIPILAERFTRQYLEEHGEKAKLSLGRDLLKEMLEYDWPGNVRELENLIRVATALRRGDSLRSRDLPLAWREKLGAPKAPRPVQRETMPSSSVLPSSDLPFEAGKTWRQTETLILAKALQYFGFDARKAAKSLDCAPSKLYQRMREDRVAERVSEWNAHPWAYREGMTLGVLKGRVVAAALAGAGGSPYQAARTLGVSPGMVYQWKEIR